MLFTLDQLKAGQKAIIHSYHDEGVGEKLLEMGCTPGDTITLSKVAPLGCPIAISIYDYTLSLRKKEAATVEVKIVG